MQLLCIDILWVAFDSVPEESSKVVVLQSETACSTMVQTSVKQGHPETTVSSSPTETMSHQTEERSRSLHFLDFLLLEDLDLVVWTG